MTDMRTPLAKVRGSGSAKEGTDHFWAQRLTAVANIPLIVFLVGFIVFNSGAGHAEITAAISNPLIALLLLLTVASVLYHMRLGMQVVIEDYIHGEGLKIALLLLNTFAAIALGAAMAIAILKLAFGG